jgi:hypothetical protein
MKTYLFYCSLLLLPCWACDPQEVIAEDETLPVTDFQFGLNSGDCKNEDYEIAFQNQSTKFDSVVWDLGNGAITSELNPTSIYQEPGDYNAKLTVYRSGETMQVIKKIVVPNRNVGATGSISYKRLSKDNTIFEFTIETESPGYWLYFGDGSRTYEESSSKTIKHTYASFGTYKIVFYPVEKPDELFGCYSSIIELEFAGM